MRLEELVGKKIVRTGCNEFGDLSYTDFDVDNYLECVETINNIPIIKIVNSISLDKIKYTPVSFQFNDDRWIDATEAYDRLVKLNNKHNN